MPTPTYPVIGIAGPARSGKDTCAGFLVQALGGYRYGFADPLKSMLAPLGIDMTDPYWEENKEKEIPLFGRSLRYLLQTLGTEWGRNIVHPDIWVLLARRTMMLQGEGMVIADVRFENEAQFIRSVGGKILHITRPGAEAVRPHASENGVQFEEADFVLSNDGTLDELCAKLADLFYVG